MWTIPRLGSCPCSLCWQADSYLLRHRGSPCSTKFLIVRKPYLSFFFFFAICDFGVISKKALPNSRSWRFMPVFSPNSFIVLTLMFRYMIHWVNFYVWSACGYPVVQHHFLKDFFPPLNSLGILVENQLTINVRAYFWTFRSLLLIYLYVLNARKHCLDYCRFVVSFEMGKCESSNLVLLSQDCFQYLVSLAISCEIQDHLIILC